MEKTLGRYLIQIVRENSEMTIVTTRMISENISNQMSRKLNEVKSSLNSQIQDAITTAIAEKVLLFIQISFDMNRRGNFAIVDRRSNGLQRMPEAVDPQKTRKNHPKTGFT